MDTELQQRWSRHAHRRLREAGLRAGAARVAIVDQLAVDGQCLMTAAELSHGLRNGAAASTATVYRVLDELFELGLVHRFDGRDGVARYEIADPDTHHHHFVDEVTGKVSAISDDELERAIHETAIRLGIRLSGHDLVLRGTRTG